jgi:carbamoyl-phosphate synthase large subunit
LSGRKNNGSRNCCCIELKLRQPPNATARTEPEVLKVAALGYPPSGGAAPVLGAVPWKIVHDMRPERYMREASQGQNMTSPVLLDRFLNDAIE